MQKKKVIIGIDISKRKLDVCILQIECQSKQHQVITNDKPGLKLLLKQIKSLRITHEEVVFCFENTGIYGMVVCSFLQEQGIDYCMVPAIIIKRSKGISRGKNDKVDSYDIADYALTHLHNLKYHSLPDEDLIKLKVLLSQREKLVGTIKLFLATNECDNFLSKEVSKDLLKQNERTINFLKKQLKEVDALISEIMKNNEKIDAQMKLITSIPGVGKQTATQLIVSTGCFELFSDARQLACYAGIAPFEYSSGSSIRGRTRVSHMANKKLKSVLHMDALTAKKYDLDLKTYFERKRSEGKNGMLVMNAVRFKLLTRIVAVVQRGTPYVNLKKYA